MRRSAGSCGQPQIVYKSCYLPRLRRRCDRVRRDRGLALAARAVRVRLGEKSCVEWRVRLATCETAKRPEGAERLLHRLVAGEAPQTPLRARVLCCVRGRRPVRHLHDVGPFDVRCPGPSACVASTFAPFTASGAPRGGSRTSAAAPAAPACCRSAHESPGTGALASPRPS
jgi:hypothetical protein